MFSENDIKTLLKHLNSPHFLTEFIINKHLVLLELKKKNVEFNKPIYTGIFEIKASLCEADRICNIRNI